jgi:phosphoesterase RecJ-like protein
LPKYTSWFVEINVFTEIRSRNLLMENIEQLLEFLAVPRYIVITSHRNPDGDAIGSSLGLYHFLNKFGHTVRVIFPF